MKALTCAGYDYMKLMVAELQRQLEEIEGQCKEKQLDAVALSPPKEPPPRRQNPFNKSRTTEPHTGNTSGLLYYCFTSLAPVLTPLSNEKPCPPLCRDSVDCLKKNWSASRHRPLLFLQTMFPFLSYFHEKQPLSC